MMSNPFDKFDSNQTENPFDRFDNPAPKKPRGFGQVLSDEITQIPRQLGLTGRHALEGVGGMLNFAASPIRGAMNAVLPSSMHTPEFNFSGLADSVGLPTPQNATERVVGDMSRMVAGGAAPIGLAGNLAKSSAGMTQAIAQQMAANPMAQLASAGAAGGAGGYTRETGGDASAQFLASLAAGIGTPMLMNQGMKAVNSAKNMMTKPTPQTIHIKIENAFKGSDVDFGRLPRDVQNSIRSDVQKALSTGNDVSPENLRRLADYRLIGATPTRAGITLDPAIVTQQRNLAKLGINSKDLAAQELGQVANQNNAKLIERMNTLGASRGMENEAAGEILSRSLADVAASNKAKIGGLYDAARDSTGRAAPLDPSHFTQKLGDQLNQANLEAFMPNEIRTMVNNFATGKTPLNVNTAEQFKTIVGNAQRASNDGNVRMALGLVRQSLDDTPLLGQVNGGNQLALPGQSSQLGQSAIDAFNKARSANRDFMGQVERTPALAAAMDDASVKGFFDKFVLSGDSKQLKNTLNAIGDNPQAVQSIRDNVLAHLKSKATGGAADEVAAFSQSNYNKALMNIGSNKLKLLFSPDEINQLKAMGRVASYEQFQPVGAAVNNSNTAGAVGGMLERIGNSPLLSKIPMGKMLAEPIQNISIGINSKNALNVPNAIATPQFMTEQQRQMMMNPAMFGLLGYQQTQ